MARIFEYLITAADGASVADSSGNGRNLTVTAPVGEAAFADLATGRAFQVTAPINSSAAALRRQLTAGEIAALNAIGPFTILVSSSSLGNASTSGGYLLHIGTAGAEKFCIRYHQPTGFWLVLDGQTLTRAELSFHRNMMAIKVDFSAADQADRVRVARRSYGSVNGTPTIAFGSGGIPQNWEFNITDPATYITLLNSAAGSQNLPLALGFFAIEEGILTDEECWARFDAIETDTDDISTFPGAAAPDLTGSDVINIGTTTATARVYTTALDGPIYALRSANATEDNSVITSTGATQTADGSEFYDFPLSGMTPGSSNYMHFLHVSSSGTTKLVIPFSTLAKMVQTLITTMGVPTGYSYATLPDNYDRSSWKLPRTLPVGSQIIVPDAKMSINAQGDIEGDTEEEIDIYVIAPTSNGRRISRVTVSSANLVTAVRPDAPVLDDRPNVEPGSVQEWTFVTSGYAVGETIDIQAFGPLAAISIDGGTPVGSATDIPVNTPGILYATASSEFGGVENAGLQMTGGVTASAVMTTRAALTPVITEQPNGPAATTIGVPVTIDGGVTGAAEIQWHVNDVAISGATSFPLVYTPASVGSFSFGFSAISPEGATITSDSHVVNVIAQATRITIAGPVRNYAGVDLSGTTVTVNIHADDNNRKGAFLRSTQVTLAANGQPTNIDSNQNGSVGELRWYSFPASSGFGRSEAAYQTTVVSI